MPLLLLVVLSCMSIASSASTEVVRVKKPEKVEKKRVVMPPSTTSESIIEKGFESLKHLAEEAILPSNRGNVIVAITPVPNWSTDKSDFLPLDAFKELMNGISPAGKPGTSIETNDSDDTTTGIVVKLEELVNPLAQALYLFIDSLLRAFRRKALPCLITSWIPLEATCTPLVNSPHTNQPVPAPSGPRTSR